MDIENKTKEENDTALIKNPKKVIPMPEDTKSDGKFYKINIFLYK